MTARRQPTTSRSCRVKAAENSSRAANVEYTLCDEHIFRDQCTLLPWSLLPRAPCFFSVVSGRADEGTVGRPLHYHPSLLASLPLSFLARYPFFSTPHPSVQPSSSPFPDKKEAKNCLPYSTTRNGLNSPFWCGKCRRSNRRDARIKENKSSQCIPASAFPQKLFGPFSEIPPHFAGSQVLIFASFFSSPTARPTYPPPPSPISLR